MTHLVERSAAAPEPPRDVAVSRPVSDLVPGTAAGKPAGAAANTAGAASKAGGTAGAAGALTHATGAPAATVLEGPPEGVSAWPGVARIRRAMERHPAVVDGLLVAVLAIGPALTLGFPRSAVGQGGPVARDLVNLAGCVALFWRRRRPVQVFVAIYVLTSVSVLLGPDSAIVEFALLVALYTLAAYRPRRAAWWGFAALEAGLALAVARWHVDTGRGVGNREVLFVDFLALSCVAVTAFVLGVNMRTRRQYLASLQDRAERAERERDQQAQIAAAGERARIAREMHDIVAHNLSVMIALADGAAFAIRNGSSEAEHAARQVSDTGRQALGEMRRLLGVLRDNQPDGERDTLRAPQPGIAAIDDVVGQVRAAGLAARLSVTGSPFDVPQTAQLAVFRLVQESLTNVLKHAVSPSEVRVRLRYREPVVEVEVIDDGREAQPARASAGGHGITGMRERVAMFGGEVSAAPRPGGGWRVAARFDITRGSQHDAEVDARGLAESAADRGDPRPATSMLRDERTVLR